MSFDDRLLNGVTALAAVVRSGGFAAAARSLNVSQPGISRAVARLEDRVGIRLLERTTRSVSLTDEGRRFYETISPILSALEEATSALAEGKVTVRGRLRVNMDPYFSQLILGPQLSGFLKAYPELKVDLITRGPRRSDLGWIRSGNSLRRAAPIHSCRPKIAGYESSYRSLAWLLEEAWPPYRPAATDGRTASDDRFPRPRHGPSLRVGIS